MAAVAQASAAPKPPFRTVKEKVKAGACRHQWAVPALAAAADDRDGHGVGGDDLPPADGWRSADASRTSRSPNRPNGRSNRGQSEIEGFSRCEAPPHRSRRCAHDAVRTDPSSAARGPSSWRTGVRRTAAGCLRATPPQDPDFRATRPSCLAYSARPPPSPGRCRATVARTPRGRRSSAAEPDQPRPCRLRGHPAGSPTSTVMLYVAWTSHGFGTRRPRRPARRRHRRVEVGDKLVHTPTGAIRASPRSAARRGWPGRGRRRHQRWCVARLDDTGNRDGSRSSAARTRSTTTRTKNSYAPSIAGRRRRAVRRLGGGSPERRSKAQVRVSRLNAAGTVDEVVGGANPINIDPSAQAGAARIDRRCAVRQKWARAATAPEDPRSRLDDAGTV